MEDVSYMIEMKHVCKFCSKRFPCGRSLGGHMRSHLITNQTDHHDHTTKEKVNSLMEKKKNGDQDPNPIKSCKECGKAFHSSKALSGHMKSHAVERNKQKEKENSFKCDQGVQATKQQQQQEEDQEEFDRESDNEGVEEAAKRKCRPRRGIRRQRYMGATSASATATYSSVSEIDQQEQENVAMCLIMLSRDVGPWGGVNYEVSDTNSVFLEHKKVADETGENKGLNLFKWVGETRKDLETQGLVADEVISSGYKKFLEKMKSREGSGAEFSRNLSSKSVLVQQIGARKRKAKAEDMENSDKRSNFECTTCNKTFHSYQALGGHRASHKKAKGCSPLNPEQISDVPVQVHSNQAKDSTEARSKKGAQMINKHECPICLKEFPSGQALGGHKRSHLMANTAAPLEVERSNATTVTTTTTTTNTTTSSSHEVRDFLDLNLPAPVEEEATNGHHHHHQQLELGGFKPWWVESSHKHEQIVGLISN